MSKWQELDVHKLPPDILMEGIWEIGYRIRRPETWEPKECPNCGSDDKAVHKKRRITYEDGSHEMIKYCTDSWHDEPKQPTHEEIITRWWNIDGIWQRALSYERNIYRFMDHMVKGRSEFIKIKSADIPPEEKDV